jgi:signal transduction histidine kinase
MRRRLVLAIAGVAAAAVVTFAVPLGVVLARSYRDSEILRLQRDTVAITRAIDVGRSLRDPIELPPSRDAVAVYDRAGRRVTGRGPATADAVVRAALASGKAADGAGPNELIAAVPLVAAERVAGAVRAARSDAAAERRAIRSWLALAALAAALVLAAVVAAILLGRRLAGPLERLAATARRLGEGDFSVRAEPAAIPEVDAVAGALGTTARRIDDLLARERAFSADASHQLRTPLAALRIELEAMALRGEGGAELEAALAQVDRLQGTVDTLLAVARDVPRSDTATDLTALVDDAEARWRGPLAAAGRPLRTVVLAADPVASASAGVIAEIVDVLIDNSRGHGAGAVTVTVRDAGGSLAIDVADEGPGFAGDPEAAFRRRGERDADGHGIGLALARSLAEAEGGRLRVARAGPSPQVTLLLPPRPRG